MQIEHERARRLVAWRKHAGYDHVPFDAWSDWPRFYALFARRPRPKSIAVLDLKSMTMVHFASVAEYLDMRWGREVDFEAATGDVTLEPAIVRAPPAQRRRVVHPKLGVGVVLGEAEGKLRIDFGAAGIKTIAASFVQDAP